MPILPIALSLGKNQLRVPVGLSILLQQFVALEKQNNPSLPCSISLIAITLLFEYKFPFRSPTSERIRKQ